MAVSYTKESDEKLENNDGDKPKDTEDEKDDNRRFRFKSRNDTPSDPPTNDD